MSMINDDDQRTIQRLAQEALEVQDACNLSGVVHAWSRSVSRLRQLHPELGTDGINRHPINQLFADKCYQLAGCSQQWTDTVQDAYALCQDIARS